MLVARTDKSIFGRWWWTVDRLLISVIIVLCIIGTFLVAAASPAVAERIGLSSFHFVNRHFFVGVFSLLAMIGISMLSDVNIRRMAVLGLLGTLVLMAATLVFGMEAKGATRWIRFFGFQLQPSEFMKPCFAIFSAWLLSRQIQGLATKNYFILAFVFTIIVGLLLAQPDFGMTFLTVLILGAQVFVAGFPYILMFGLMALAGLLATWAYFNLPHVTSRVDRFIDPASGDTYQIQKSIASFAEGGFFGVGPGEGTVKMLLPDAHADFIFAVSGEEMGFILTFILVLIFAFIAWRSIMKAFKSGDLFVLLAVTGLITQFVMQAMIHMGSSLHMIPTKGMTLPFVSYGGSSLLSICIGFGFILGLTRKKPSFSGLKNVGREELSPYNNGMEEKQMPFKGKIS
tara:strand:+ start:410 stop:1609 length:1200 start_codon:yes stop_codon:yes gene_type:complete